MLLFSFGRLFYDAERARFEPHEGCELVDEVRVDRENNERRK